MGLQVDGEVLDPVSKDTEADDIAVARFLRTCPGLSKAIIGDLLGQNTERALRVLDAFTHMFDFSGAAHWFSQHHFCPMDVTLSSLHSVALNVKGFSSLCCIAYTLRWNYQRIKSYLVTKGMW